jgi:hypothetical protein
MIAGKTKKIHLKNKNKNKIGGKGSRKVIKKDQGVKPIGTDVKPIGTDEKTRFGKNEKTRFGKNNQKIGTGMETYEKVHLGNDMHLLPNMNTLVGDAGTMSDAFKLKGVQDLSNIMGIDISDKEALHIGLRNINESLSNPENTKEILAILSNIALTAGLYMEVAEPMITPFINITVAASSEFAETSLNSASRILGNALKAIPGIGTIYLATESIEKVAEAYLAFIKAGMSIARSGSELVDTTAKNMDRFLIAQDEKIMNLMTRNKKFNKNFKNNQSNQVAPVVKAPVVKAPVAPVVKDQVAPVVKAPVAPVVKAPVAPVIKDPVVPVVKAPVAPVQSDVQFGGGDIRSRTEQSIQNFLLG